MKPSAPPHHNAPATNGNAPNHRSASPGMRMTMLQSPGVIVEGGKVKKNAKGGIQVSQHELKAAFSLLDVDKTGQVNLQNLKKRLGLFFPEMTAKEYRFLMNNRKELTLEDFQELLLDNDLDNFDPTIDAFKAFDSLNEGFINPQKLRELFSACNFGEISDEEIDIMSRAADVDGDGVIGLEDFRSLLNLHA